MAVEVDYARRGDISIAFQSIGQGALDIIFGAGLVSHLDLLWGDPRATSFLRGLASIGRLIIFDKPGTGLSDPVVGTPTLDQRVEDYLAVLDAAQSRRAVVIGFSEASTPGYLLASVHPERVEAFISVSGGPALMRGEWASERVAERLENTIRAELHSARTHWGDGGFLMALSPFVRNSAVYRRLAPSVERASASPGMARAIIESSLCYDATDVLSAVRVPALIVHRRDEIVPFELSEYAAEHVPGAKLVELPGDEHMVFFAHDDVLAAVEQFLGGALPRPRLTDRRLMTILFTDIVGSTEHVLRAGDEAWTSVVERLEQRSRDEVERHDGRLIKTLGDGIMASFDRPVMAIRCAGTLVRDAEEIGVQIRTGIHAGECEMRPEDLAGVAVHVAARVAQMGGANDVLVSSTVRELVLGSGIEFDDRGLHDLKGISDKWRVFSVRSDRSKDQAPAATATTAQAAATPSPSQAMTMFDRAIVGLAARTPMLTRAALRLVRERPPRRS